MKILKIKDWIKNAQFEPILVTGNEILTARRLKDGLAFSVGTIKSGDSSVITLSKFHEDLIHVTIKFFTAKDGHMKKDLETLVQINQLNKVHSFEYKE